MSGMEHEEAADSPFPHERLDVYRLEEETLPMIAAIARKIPPRHDYLRNQMYRAATSKVLNTAEGASELSPGDKARFYRMAHRSTGELAAILRVLVKMQIVVVPEIELCRSNLSRISIMLFRLIQSQERGGSQ